MPVINNTPEMTGANPTGTISAQELLEKSQQLDAYTVNQQQLAVIDAEMRETPPPKSEVPDEKPNVLTRVEFPEEGGILTYMENFDQPFQGFPSYQLVEKMDAIKKLTKGFKSGFYHGFKKWRKHKKLVMFICSPFLRIHGRAEIYSCWRFIERFKLKPKRYCTMSREIHRVFSIPVDENEKQSTRELREMIRDLFCLHLEFDNAYRYRAQDTIVELDKSNMEKKPVNEFLRLLNIMSSREVKVEVKDTWHLTKLMFEFLKHDKEIRTILQTAFLRIDTDKCKLNKLDMCYVTPRDDYNFTNISQN